MSVYCNDNTNDCNNETDGHRNTMTRTMRILNDDKKHKNDRHDTNDPAGTM